MTFFQKNIYVYTDILESTLQFLEFWRTFYAAAVNNLSDLKKKSAIVIFVAPANPQKGKSHKAFRPCLITRKYIQTADAIVKMATIHAEPMFLTDPRRVGDYVLQLSFVVAKGLFCLSICWKELGGQLTLHWLMEDFGHHNRSVSTVQWEIVTCHESIFGFVAYFGTTYAVKPQHI